jgi:hypothetical protein
VGLGEAPLLRQATFSVWRSEADLRAYAHAGAHRRAIEAAYGEGYFSESLFARFTPVAAGGYWQGAPVSERLWGSAAQPAAPGSSAPLAPRAPSTSPWEVGHA